MDNDMREAFRNVRDDIHCLDEKFRDFVERQGKICAARGEEIAVLKDHDGQRTHDHRKRIDIRIGLGLLAIAGLTFALKYLL